MFVPVNFDWLWVWVWVRTHLPNPNLKIEKKSGTDLCGPESLIWQETGFL
jgi:hypothetical protein